jgi:hypothetical protein
MSAPATAAPAASVSSVSSPVPGLAILHEHPDWFRPLFRELEARGVPFHRTGAEGLGWEPGGEDPPFRVLFNRMSPSAYLRGGTAAIHYTRHLLRWLEERGVRVINGTQAYETEISKAWQMELLHTLGLPFPRTRVVHDPTSLPAAAEGFRFPVAVKPNVGGSGAGVVRYDTPEALEAAVREGRIGTGIDGTLLLQEFIVPEEGRIVRVEVLDGRFLYAIRVYTPGDDFNLCPADVCQTTDGVELERGACPVDAPKNGMRVEGYEPPAQVVRDVERIMEAAGIEIGGVEYLEAADGSGRYYYDINALSNFVAEGPRVVGFDPFQRLADWLETVLEGVEAGPADADPAAKGGGS